MNDTTEVTKTTRYTRSRKVAGSELSPGQWIDLPDRIGACAIKSIEIPGDWMEADPRSPVRHVRFWGDGARDFVVVDADDRYVIVDPDSAVEEGEPWPSWFRLVLSALVGR